MPHSSPLIATIVAGIGLAFLFGAVAHRLRVPPLVGYLLAGIVVGPFTPGFVADQTLAPELAEIGVILLMFGVGLHFSLKDLLKVGAIAIPGAVAQISAATLLGVGLSAILGWSLAGGMVFGLALSVASTVVLLRALNERRLVDTERGRIAVGWLIVEDLAMVLTLVLLPALASMINGTAPPADGLAARMGLGLGGVLALTLAKVALFVAIMLVVGRRVIPWVLHAVAHTGSRELFRLAVLAIALGVAFGAAHLFGVSLALGAFFAGMVLSESELSHRAAQESLPLRDAFAVLFFVSVGMLFNPAILLENPLSLLAVLAIILVGKSLAAFAIVRLFRHPMGTALTISASLAQIGEFSFILAELGVQLGLLPEQGRALILAGAIITIMLNPVMFALADHLQKRREQASPVPVETPPPPPVTELTDHVVLVGHGRVGALVAGHLRAADLPLLVMDEVPKATAGLREAGVEVIIGNAARPDVLRAANLQAARHLVVAIPNAFEAGQVVEQARNANPSLDIVARVHSDAEVDHLRIRGANMVVMGEREIANSLGAHVLGGLPRAPQPDLATCA